MGNREILGIDFGGSGIKGAPVDTKKGKLLAERHRIPTPSPSDIESVSGTICQLIDYFGWKGPVGIGFPSVVMNGTIKTAANIDKSWIGVNAQELLSKKTGLPVFIVNDADAAGYAEMKFGAGRDVNGTVLLVTVGTGIGSVLFSGNRLVANTELGHIFLDNGIEAESYAADSVRETENMDWTEWGARFNKYLNELQKLFWPELIIIGGGVSKKPERYMPALSINTEIKMACLKNDAGIIGAALAARKALKRDDD
ncbi:MAG: ROK family protein [Bacteroidales bacterium]|nr:ROK family protein [Bacteroidales bacterium]